MVEDNFFLGITTTENETGIALIKQEQVLYQKCEFTPLDISFHNETIFIFIKSAFESSSITAKDLSGIGVVLGPGRFTSLRVGIACAKGLALPHNIKIKGFNTLEALVLSVSAHELNKDQIIVPIIDIKRGEIYYQIYKHTEPISEPKITNAHEIANIFPPNAILVGSGVMRYAELLKNNALKPYRICSQHNPNPTIIAQYARQAILSGKTDELTDINPIYIRPV
ncbi:MAG: tRNA (adenosine(37)-N6)-threonylcarbamoyltransferase complex dimerization subunit type 1 TsaB [candidate division WOR-3 bacterium]|nr:tRNA (adenosine(37)-N6)-threonylcarbamoyltransferase complex dimerization subunit type 1 TsaB [candidate division WOR-3 bacterium]MDW7988044.1 tRNA (adenosine(37)-N6)-threonylcarbamoyltransferase complex dimerization subunit type 1 TsaB [candidate division WOR-3 bacterium]